MISAPAFPLPGDTGLPEHRPTEPTTFPPNVSESPRVALLLDPLTLSLDPSFNLKVKWGNHAPQLARELLGRGYTVRGFGAPPGVIPRSSEVEFEGSQASAWWGKLRNFKPDILVAYDALSGASFRGARMARKLDATLVLVEAALPGGGTWLDRTLTRVGEKLFGHYVRRTARAVVAFDQVARKQALSEGFAAEIVSVVRHGVDTQTFRPGLSSTLVARQRIRGRMLLYVGRLSKGRGVDDLMAAFGRTLAQRSDWNLVLCGEGSHQPELRAMADRLGIAARVHWMGFPRREELPGLIGASAIFATPAHDDVVVGRQITRAMACGVPVLASDLPRLRDLVLHEETGLLVNPGDVDAWTEAIRRVASSPVARERWAKNGRAKAVAELSWQAVVDRFEQVFAQARGTELEKEQPASSLPHEA